MMRSLYAWYLILTLRTESAIIGGMGNFGGRRICTGISVSSGPCRQGILDRWNHCNGVFNTISL
jgi:hypothetical protein